MKSTKTLEEQLYRMGWCFLAAAFLFMFVYFHYIMPNVPTMSCVILHVLGIYCPGCGGTRAVAALMNGQVLLSLWYHPLVLYSAVFAVGFMGTHTLEKLHIGHIRGWKFHNWYLYTALAVIACNWILKNILLRGFGITL